MLVGLTVIVGLLGFAGNITGLVGKFFCMSVPGRAGSAKELLTGSIVLEIMALGLGMLHGFAEFMPGRINPVLNQIFMPAQLLLILSSTALFLSFCKSVARFIRRHELAAKAKSVVRFFLISIGCCFLGVVVMVVMRLAGGIGAAAGAGNAAAGGVALSGSCAFFIGLIAAGVSVLFAVVKFVTLMKELSDAVGRYARKTRKAEEAEKKKDAWEKEGDEDDRRPTRRKHTDEDD